MGKVWYTGSSGSADYIDFQTDNQLSFRNVLVLRCESKNQGDDAGHLTINMTGSGSGYYACGGTVVPLRWSRVKTADPLHLHPGGRRQTDPSGEQELHWLRFHQECR